MSKNKLTGFERRIANKKKKDNENNRRRFEAEMGTITVLSKGKTSLQDAMRIKGGISRAVLNLMDTGNVATPGECKDFESHPRIEK